MVLHLFAICYEKPPALWLGELVAASAHLTLSVRHLPLLHGAEGQVAAEENVEGCVYLLHEFVTDKDDPVEAVEDHADF